jgi:tyrosyl-tRNA synthetase
MTFLEELRWRGLLQEITPGLEELLETGEKLTGYVGYDPTAPSLTIGNLVTVMLLRVFQDHGHKPLVLMGGATGRIGDPSGKSEERKLLSIDTLRQNLEAQKGTFHKLLDFDPALPHAAEIFDNYEIYRDMNVLTFLRDVGKHITVNYMSAKESVKTRMETGISFTEFSYQLLQGYDFAWLYEHKQVRLQMGGSDQWGNILTGKELIGRIHDGRGHGLTCPLLTKADGSKFGKSEKGNVWLDGALTTPYEFYQFWLNAADDDVVRFNRIYTLKPFAEVEDMEAAHRANPGARIVQKSLAEELTVRLHGPEGLQLALDVTAFLFDRQMGPDKLHATPKLVFETASRAVDTFAVTADKEIDQLPLAGLLTELAPVFSSKREFRQAIKENALSVNRQKVTSEETSVQHADLIHGQYILVEYGKKKQFLISMLAF